MSARFNEPEMTCTPDPERRAILCGPRSQELTPEDLAAVAEFERFLRERHAAKQTEQTEEPDQDQPPRPPKDQP